jgi:hypothetical protein
MSTALAAPPLAPLLPIVLVTPPGSSPEPVAESVQPLAAGVDPANLVPLVRPISAVELASVALRIPDRDVRRARRQFSEVPGPVER